ncbi:MAG: MOSC N-terminal beta barrel domain-containing protein [Burkholderiales bacterium]|nr:MOSC N-terminal beta barrel domain-containing protein [Burkholderiales bacterium]
MADTLADFDLACRAAALYVYPIKACAGVAVPELVLDARGGAVGDRGWAIVDAGGAVTWLGSYPRLALVQPALAGAGLVLRAPAVEPVATPAAMVPRQVRIWSDVHGRHETFAAEDAGDAVAAWLERVTGAPLRLVRLEDAAHARAGNNALHLVFTPSVAAVAARWAAGSGAPIDVRRFRPNIVLSLAEDGNEFVEESLEALAWQGAAAGQARLDITAPCIRCVVPNVDPATARVDETLLDTLAGLSLQRRPGGTAFGVYARGPAGARLRVGDVARMLPAF